VCDLVRAADLPKTFAMVPFAVVAEASIEELKRYEQFIAGPQIYSSK